MDFVTLVDPEIAPLLSTMSPLEFLDEQSLPQHREARAVGRGSLSDRVIRTDINVPGPPGQPDVTLRVHRPKAIDGRLPCVFSIHGGGYVMGSRFIDDGRMDRWCPDLSCVGISVEYRLAPECPYPGPLEDCYAGLRWVHEHASELGVDPQTIGVVGGSAGGGLAAALALLARDRGKIPVAFQLLVYPMIDDRMVTESSRWDAPIWNPSANAFGWRSYLGDLFGTADVPAYAAPARAVDLSGLPVSYVCVGTLDGFLDEDIEYAQRLNHMGTPTDLHVYPGAPHGFVSAMPDTTVSTRCWRDMTEWLSRQLNVER